ncbi:T9SS type A sorting domain-containing protein [Joostella atrarenae]|uniref:T9SS type A sorting domain-containing protein n=1 Tax=Joostella atrarenae TaxID=679257 RepID=A0ABS9J3I2_9FLAO|nr:T9SS type A sorting domain-containing protein [Joostella atrarenae]MCF8714992.1 T9SS type A sorting domain-containing protein [Joostella atrarenae]
MKSITISLAFIVMVLISSLNKLYAQDTMLSYDQPVSVGTITNPDINEASGIAASYKTQGAFWVHNDSGDGPNLFLIDSLGNTLTEGSVTNASSNDWEDIASFQLNGTSYLVIGDVGDNPRNRSEYRLFIIEEPAYDPQSISGNTYSIVKTIKYQYSNGKQNCESVAVDSHTGKIILFSKSHDNEIRYVYELPLSITTGTENLTAELIASLKSEDTTAMDISNNGHHAAVLTYKDFAYQFIRKENETWQDAFQQPYQIINMPVGRQGEEALAYGTNGADLYSVREGTSSKIWFLKAKNQMGNNAEFISQSSIPQRMERGQQIDVSVTMKNAGTTTWTREDSYKLGSFNDDDSFGFVRVQLDSLEEILPNEEKTFDFSITAPDSLETYNFQWKVVQEFVEWFGEETLPKKIKVVDTLQGDIIGNVITGYQGWFSATGDNSPRNKWVHWGTSQPSPGNQSFELYPDMREYNNGYQTGYANLGNGQPSTLFSSYDDQVVNKHFEWMQNYGIEVAALQRFGSELNSSSLKAQRDGMALKVKSAAETYGRKFYIMYDISSWSNFQTEIKSDWNNTVTSNLQLLQSPAYAKQDGKPVVCIWGLGTPGRPGNNTSYKDVIEWFKNKGYYVIIGLDKNWRQQSENFPAYNEADMINPWHVGTLDFNGLNSQKFNHNWVQKIADDMEYCKTNGIDYMPGAWPGFAWSNWKEGYEDRPNSIPRMHGDFMWQQFYYIKSKFNEKQMPASAYVAMFDEYDEGTAIAKAAEDASMIPTNQYFLTLDADGVQCSSDFYLRLTGNGAKMLKEELPLTLDHEPSTPHTLQVQSNDAEFVSYGNIPSVLHPGDTVSIDVTYKNIGSTTWLATGNYKLGSENPQDNTNWGTNRVYLSSGESVEPNETVTFNFDIIAPLQEGTYNFQWKMVQDGVSWFGELSDAKKITISDEYLDTCDTLNGWNTEAGNNLSGSGTFVQGTASVKTTGNATDEFFKVFSPAYNSGTSISMGKLSFSYYADAADLNGIRVELGSGGQADTDELQWTLQNLSSGWNEIELPFIDAETIGAPNLNAINWFRLYNDKSGTSVTTRIDGIKIKMSSGLAKSFLIEENFTIEDTVGMKLFPNPATNMIKIRLYNEFSEKDKVDVVIYNTSGQKLLNRQFSNSKNTELKIDTEQFSKGVYVVSIKQGNRIFEKKLIIK